METPEIVIQQNELFDFIKSKDYENYSSIFVTRLEEVGKSDAYTWPVFTNEEQQIIKSSKFSFKDNSEWPLYFIWPTIETTIQQPITPKNPTKHFVSMNNKQHYHRCYVMDRLNQKGLLTNNVYSWTGEHTKHDGYTWLTNLPKSVIQKDYDYDALITQYNVPQDIFENTAFSVVLESLCNDYDIFFTEKTFIPIYHKRPLVVLGNYKHWDNLCSYGFKEYPFIDYSFDKEKDNTKRMDMFINEVQRITREYSPKKIIKMSKFIIEHNYNIMQECYLMNKTKPKWFDNRPLKVL